MTATLLIAQLTDLHVGAEDDPSSAGNFARFAECLAAIGSAIRRPDLVLLTGDIAEKGDEASYARVFSAMEALGVRWAATLGNHDDPAAFRAAAAQSETAFFKPGGVVEAGSWRIVLADTRREGRTGGYFDEARARLLDEMLAACPEVPTLLAIHHPPVAVGIDWIDPEPEAAWIGCLRKVLLRHRQVHQIICGHVHVPVMTQFGGIPLSIAPATAAQSWPELAPYDPAAPDGRTMMVEGVPGFALHRLGERAVTTLFCSARPGATCLAHSAPGNPAAD